MCINFIRAQQARGLDPRSALIKAINGEGRPWVDDRYMQQVLENDSLLMHDWDDADMEEEPRYARSVSCLV